MMQTQSRKEIMVADTIKELPEYSQNDATKCGLKLETNCVLHEI